MKDIYNKVKGDMTNKPGDENNDMFVIKVPANKNINDVLNKIKAKGAMTVKPKGEEPDENESLREGEKPYTSVQYVKVGGEDLNKPTGKEPIQYIKVSRPKKPSKG